MAGPVGSPGRSRGYTMMEILIVVLIVGILAALVAPPVARIREAARLQNGRHMITAALSLGRATGPQWGRMAVVHIDPGRDELRVEIDTGTVGGGDPMLVRRYTVGADIGVDLRSNLAAVCYTSRGVGTTGPACPSSGGWIAVVGGSRADTVRVTSVGRLR